MVDTRAVVAGGLECSVIGFKRAAEHVLFFRFHHYDVTVRDRILRLKQFGIAGDDAWQARQIKGWIRWIRYAFHTLTERYRERKAESRSQKCNGDQ